MVVDIDKRRVSALMTSRRLTCLPTKEHTRWITPNPPWEPLDDDGNEVPVDISVSTAISRWPVSAVDDSLYRIPVMMSRNKVGDEHTRSREPFAVIFFKCVSYPFIMYMDPTAFMLGFMTRLFVLPATRTVTRPVQNTLTMR